MSEETGEDILEKDSLEESVCARFDEIDARFDALNLRLEKVELIYADDLKQQLELISKISTLRL